MRYQPEWSADGKRIAFSDKDGKIYVVTLADRKVTEIADSPRGQIRDYIWSPRGNYLAFSMAVSGSGFASVYIWNAADGKLNRLTDDMFNAYNPAWDPQGNYLYFLSDREFAPQISQIEFNYATNRDAYIYAMSLRKDVKHPFPPESDEVAVTKPDEAPKPQGTPPALEPKAPAKDLNKELNKEPATETDKEKPAPSPTPEAKADAAAKPPANLIIDFDGISGRAARVPLGADNYGGLSAKTGHLLYGSDRRSTTADKAIGRQRFVSTPLKIAKRRPSRKMCVATRCPTMARRYWWPRVRLIMYDATPVGDKSRKPVSTAGLVVDRVPAEEWNQIFNEVWRRYRDWFYVSNMHGYDWVALREQYKPLLQYVAHRSDLNYVISEMISELTVQHAYIEGGDFQIPPRPRVGLPGARFELDKASGRYRIAKIFEGQNEEDIYRSPLTEVGVNASVGDYVLAIDGEELKGTDDPYRLLRNKADNPVQLTVNKKPVDGWLAHDLVSANHRRKKFDLSGLDQYEPAQSFGSDRRTRRLHSHSRHGRQRNSRIHQVVLPADTQGSADRRRARKWRRQRFAHADRATAPQVAGAELFADCG